MRRGVKCVRCAKCCHDTKMELSIEDVERLERLGFNRREFSVEDEDCVLRLRNVRSVCCFLIKAESRCRVYPNRPRGCAIYPVNITNDGDIVVDDDCRAASTVTPAEMERKGAELKRLISKIDSETAARKSKRFGLV